jgi:hypothetical protein
MYSYSLQEGLLFAKRLPGEMVNLLVGIKGDEALHDVNVNKLLDEIAQTPPNIKAPNFNLVQCHTETLMASGIIYDTLFNNDHYSKAKVKAIDIVFIHWADVNGAYKIAHNLVVSDNEPDLFKKGFLKDEHFFSVISSFIKQMEARKPGSFEHIPNFSKNISSDKL